MTEKKTLIPEYIFFSLAFIFAVFVRIRFSDMAFERDEGEYAYAGAEILRGGIPYRDFYNMKLPGVYYCYALIFFLFGKTVSAVRLSVMVLNLMNSFFILKIGQKWFDARTGWLSASIFLVFSVSSRTQGLVSNCEHFVLFFLFVSIFCLSRQYYFWAGLCAGLCLMMKQQALFLLIFVALYFTVELYRNWSKSKFLKPFLSISIVFLLPFALFFTTLWQKNALNQFYFFVVDYAQQYISLKETNYFPFSTFSYILNYYEWFWGEAVVASLFIISHTFFRKNMHFSTPYNPFLLILLFLCAYAAVLPGMFLRPHYFIYLNPAVAFLAGYGLACLRIMCVDKALIMSYFLVLAVSMGTVFYEQLPEFCRWRDGDYVNALYGGEHFNETQELGEVIELNAQTGDKIGLACHEPQLAFYSNLKMASGYLYDYPFYENQPLANQMLQQFFNEMAYNKPRWYVLNMEKYGGNDNQSKLDEWSSIFERDYAIRAVVYNREVGKKTIEWNVGAIDSTRKKDAVLVLFERGDSATLKPLILEK